MCDGGMGPLVRRQHPLTAYLDRPMQTGKRDRKTGLWATTCSPPFQAHKYLLFVSRRLQPPYNQRGHYLQFL